MIEGRPLLRNANGELIGRIDGDAVVTSLAEELEAVPVPFDWGGWELDARVLVLRTERIPGGYEVDLEWCLDSAQVLDWICQIAHKDRTDQDTITGLVNALDDVLYPQHRLCPGSKSKQITAGQVRELARQAAARRKQSLAVYGEWWREAEAMQ